MMRGCSGGAGRDEGMMGALRGAGSADRKGRRLCCRNEAAHLVPPSNPGMVYHTGGAGGGADTGDHFTCHLSSSNNR